jgi:UDP-galactopyranose mutase
MTTFDFVIVGAGLSGATIAQMAAQDGYKVLVIDKRNHIAGNCYDEVDEQTGIRINKYGAHIFHTNDEEVWNYVQQFGPWRRWDHKVIADVSGLLVPIPVCPTTVNTLLGTNISSEAEMKEWLKNNTIPCQSPKNSAEIALSRVGPELYKLLFQEYTKKQWDKDPSELDPSVLARIPVRHGFDERYFSDKFQGLPEDGYTTIVENMLNHPNISVRLGISWEDFQCAALEEGIQWRELIFTGRIDQYFHHLGLPPLEYRSINFQWIRMKNSGYFQPNSVVNFPMPHVPYTRCVEYKHFLHQKGPWTIVCFETTCADGEPYYPVPTIENMSLYERYNGYAGKEKHVHFVGRLASYKYFNMDQAIRNAMDYYRMHLCLRKIL